MVLCCVGALLQQHDRPATLIDAAYLMRAGIGSGPQGELWSASSRVGGAVYASVFGATLTSAYSVPLAYLGFHAEQTVVMFEANTTSTVTVLSANASVPVAACDKFDFQLYSIAPVYPNGVATAHCPPPPTITADHVPVFPCWEACLYVHAGWAILGETAKWVPVNNMRFSDVAWDSSSVTVTLRGSENEDIEVRVGCAASCLSGASTALCGCRWRSTIRRKAWSKCPARSTRRAVWLSLFPLPPASSREAVALTRV